MQGSWPVVVALVILALGCGGDPAPAREQGEVAGADDDDSDTEAHSPRARDAAAVGNDRSPPRNDASAAGDARRDAGSSGSESALDARTPAAPVDGSKPMLNASDAAVMPPGEPGPSEPGASARLPPVSSTSMDGPFRATQDLRAGPAGKSGLFRPSELGKGGLKHPVFVWGCGGGSTPMSYAELLSRVASHGFVVIAEVAAIGDNGAPLRAAIDWVIAESGRSGSPLFGMVDTSKIALGGHSIGSANSFYVADDPRLTTTIHVAGGSLDNVRDPRAPTTGMGGKRLIHPVAYICSMSDTFGNVEKTQKDYDNTTAPAWMTVMTGTEHTGAARSGMPAIIAWLRWQLAGESERKRAFLEPGGEFARGIFVSRSKNW